MKPTHIAKSRRIRVAMAFAGAVGMSSALAMADRGSGSIRGAARAEPAARSPERGGGHVEERRAPVEEHRAPVEERRAPEVRRDEHVEVRQPVEVRHDWDEHDEDGRHFGGFGPGVPVRIYRGERFHALPAHYHRFHYGSVDYYLDDDTGAYYMPETGGEYVVVQPPVGAVVPALPPGAVPVVAGPTTFYYLDGTFYLPQPGGVAVVNPPPGIVVPSLPTGANQILINGNVLFQFNGFNYQPILAGGVTMYTVTPA